MSETVWDEQVALASNDAPLEQESFGIDEVDEDYPSDNLVGLINLGRLTKEVTVRGNRVRLRTLTIGEELEVGLLVQPYANTLVEGRAYACAVIAASVDSVNGKPLVTNFGPGEGDLLRRRFDHVRNNWYWPVIEELYEQFVTLQAEQFEALEELRSK